MLAHESKKSHILIATDIESAYEELRQRLSEFRVVGFIEEDFKLEHAKAVVAEAYISEANTKYIIFAGIKFTKEAQNSLLKALEEPPRNIEFIIITSNKSNLLPTIRSRLPIIYGKVSSDTLELELNLARLDYDDIFKFLKENARIKRVQAKSLIEAIYKRATITDMLILSHSQLENFDKAYRLLELNSRPQSILALILMSFISDKNAST
jgi:DNA polymerase-3 subunit delta'